MVSTLSLMPLPGKAWRSALYMPLLYAYLALCCRFFSVDGGHHFEAARSDLQLASCLLAPHGILSIDDFFHSGYDETQSH